ncbi:MAG TPA: uracil-DNA glycosylase [Caulobacteraceae bacterium]|jgi:DNA polymerase|nr:uracil-DNA glycosylase [Caulobacteraceae bacterium]
MTEDIRAAESLLAFWADAGVDVALADAPQDRMRPAPARPSPPARPFAPARPQPGETSRPATNSAPARFAAPSQATSSEGDADAIARARAAAAACSDLDSLSAAIAAFEGCPLSLGARQAVFARGAPGAPVFVIGEGPGSEEDLQGLPFVGRAGQLLDRMFAAAGISERVFISNTVFWRPPGNRDPEPQEQAVCLPFLERAIALGKPKMLLLLGACSARSMLGKKEGILALRGRWFEWASADGATELPALPTLHPAFLLRQPAAKKKAWEDMLLLRERLDRPQRP